MSNYVKATNFTAKDSLPSGDTGKVIRGSEFDTEFTNIQTAITSKADTTVVDTKAPIASPTFTGVVTLPGVTETVFAVTGTTPALSPTNGSIQTWTLSANSTPTAGTWAAGQSITFMIDDGTAYTIDWTSVAVTWKTDGGTAPTLETTGFTAVVLWKVGSTVYGARVGNA
jgi:hypothetical protein